MHSRPDVSAVITFHKEGALAHPTLSSIERCRRFAEAQGIETEFVVTLDNADEETVRVVRGHPAIRRTDQIHDVSYRDLSLCRNHAIRHANGHYVGTFDGDDYFSKNWIAACVENLRRSDEGSIFHPELMVAFGAWNAYWWQVDQADSHYRPHSLLSTNFWNACAFAARSVFVEIPYAISRPGECGFGFEDWHWNCETIAAGYVHRLAQGTARFERRKSSGSLNVAHQQHAAIVRPSAFFDRL